MGEASILKYDYVSLVYEDTSYGSLEVKTYGESIVKVTRKVFLKWVSLLSERVMERSMEQRPVGLVPAPFCVINYVKDGSCLPGYESSECEKLSIKRNSKFYRIECPTSVTSFWPYGLLAVRALQYLKYGEKLVVDFGSNYYSNK